MVKKMICDSGQGHVLFSCDNYPRGGRREDSFTEEGEAVRVEEEEK